MAEPLPFPVLGIPSWSGTSRTVLRQGTRARTDDGGFGEPSVVAVTRAYHLPGGEHAAVVIGQGPAHPGRDLAAFALHGSALSLLLRRRTGRPRVDSPRSVHEEAVTVEGMPTPALRVDWGEPRIAHVCFDWRHGRRVEIAAWEHPLGSAFFASLAP